VCVSLLHQRIMARKGEQRVEWNRGHSKVS
jgi:hypothetical protein